MFLCSFHVFFGHRESEAKAEAPAVSGNQKHNEYRCGMLFLSGLYSDQYQRSDVVFESPATPTVLYQLSLTGNMSGVYLRGEKSRRGEKTEEHLQRFAHSLEVKKKQAVKTLPLNDGARDKTNKCSAALEDGKYIAHSRPSRVVKNISLCITDFADRNLCGLACSGQNH